MKADIAYELIQRHKDQEATKEFNEIIERIRSGTSAGMDGFYIKSPYPLTLKKLKSAGYIINPWGKSHHINYGAMVFVVNPNPWYKKIRNWFYRTFIN